MPNEPSNSAAVHDQMIVAVVPLMVGLLLWPLPLAPLFILPRSVVEGTQGRRLDLFARLGVPADKVYLIDPTDIPFVFRLAPCPSRPAIVPRRREDIRPWDARIAGPFSMLIGIIHGAFDGDVLFFSPDLVIEGDTEAVVVLHNTLDDAEFDVAAEAATAFGPSSHLLQCLTRSLLPAASRPTGLALTRVV